jgi:hypothetical protein
LDISESLKAAENSIRDTISFVLTKKYGADWPSHSGISEQRLAQWQEKRSAEEKQLGRTDPRIIYYSDFYDLQTLIKKNWNNGLSEVFGKQREIEVLLDILEEIRNPDTHRRELLPHQKNLAIGISGRIRTTIAEYFSRMETGESYYPRIECVQDNYGNSWTLGDQTLLVTGRRLRPGDLIECSVSATDPLGEALEFAVAAVSSPFTYEWKESGDFSIVLDSSHVKHALLIQIAIRSKREFHAVVDMLFGKIDDTVQFVYEVLPPLSPAHDR